MMEITRQCFSCVHFILKIGKDKQALKDGFGTVGHTKQAIGTEHLIG